MAKKFYVVWKGHQPGIYTDWPSCKAQVDQFPGARYKSFPTEAEAKAAFDGKSSPSPAKRPAAKKRGSGVKTYTAKEVAAHPAKLKIFTDGGCEPNPGKAGSGVAIYRSNRLVELWYGLFNPKGTNNTAELNALHQALRFAKKLLAKDKEVAVFCDSQYAIQCITQWAKGWEKNGWQKREGVIKNLELIQSIYYLYNEVTPKVSLLHVNGHVGVEGNELADRMSILAIDERQTGFVPYQEELDIPALLALRTG
ncbi:ribonuclease H family protein [Corallincola platygyrae]|uniref:ribonuclease H n=1 Tax=Corallincola platygyrae TaxID=1193278 RepID=A0ABW4XU20_9GAMM